MRFRIHLCNALVDFIFFIIVCVSATVPLYYLTWNVIHALMLFILIVPYSFLFFLRMRRRNFFLFGFCHLLMYLIPFNIKDGFFVASLIFIIITIFVIYSYSTYFAQNNRTVSGLAISLTGVLFTVIYIVAGYLESVAIQNIILAGSICVLACYFLLTHIHNVDKTLLMVTSSSIQPVDKIIHSSNKIIIFYVILTSALLFLSRYFFIGELIRLVGTGILFLIRRLARFGAETPEPTLEPVIVPQQPMGLEGFRDDYEPFIFWRILEVLIQYLGVAFLILLTIFIVFTAIKNFYKRFGNHTDGDDIKEFIIPEIAILKSPIKVIRDRLAPSNRIRRIFYRKVKTYITAEKINVKKYDTAYEISQKIEKYENISKVLQLYEEVRYGRRHEK